MITSREELQRVVLNIEQHNLNLTHATCYQKETYSLHDNHLPIQTVPALTLEVLGTELYINRRCCNSQGHNCPYFIPQEIANLSEEGFIGYCAARALFQTINKNLIPKKSVQPKRKTMANTGLIALLKKVKLFRNPSHQT